MQEIRQRALSAMSQYRIGATLTRIGWVWRNDVRLSDEAAEAVLAKIAENHAGSE